MLFFVNETHLSSLLSAKLTRLLMGGAYGRESRPDLDFWQINIDILFGLTVALALVPEAVAFAFVAGVAPLVGLYAAFIVEVITAVFGCRPGRSATERPAAIALTSQSATICRVGI